MDEQMQDYRDLKQSLQGTQPAAQGRIWRRPVGIVVALFGGSALAGGAVVAVLMLLVVPHMREAVETARPVLQQTPGVGVFLTLTYVGLEVFPILAGMLMSFLTWSLVQRF